MKKRSKKRLVFNFFITFLGFFLFSGATIMISFLIIFRSAPRIPYEQLHRIAPYTVINLILVSVVFGILGTTWKSLTVEKPVSEINEVLMKIKKGDLSTKLKRRNYNARYSTIVNNINLMATELSSLDTLKVSLMSNISHELKTPISIISNYATLLQDPELESEKRTEYAKLIHESSKKMTELITNVLKLNQLENQNIPSDSTTFNLSEQICECLLTFEDIWDEKNIEILTDITEDVNINSDKQLLSIIWNNLFSNAFKFTDYGGTVSVKLSEGKKYAIIEISDTGCGVSEEQRELIFEKFYQCDPSRNSDGNGLGLALVKRIINITNSIIKVESEVGKGTTFTIKIPKRL